MLSVALHEADRHTLVLAGFELLVLTFRLCYHCHTSIQPRRVPLVWWVSDKLVEYMHKMRMMRRTSSYFFSFIDTTLLKLGIGNYGFAITAKVAEDDALERYEKGIMEFGSHSPMFLILAWLAMLNLVCLVGSVVRLVIERHCELMTIQFLLCGVLVMGNMPIYQAMFFRSDKGCLPTSIVLQSALLAALACFVPLHWMMVRYILSSCYITNWSKFDGRLLKVASNLHTNTSYILLIQIKVNWMHIFMQTLNIMHHLVRGLVSYWLCDRGFLLRTCSNQLRI